MTRRFQISITNVLLVFAIVGLSLGWWLDRNIVESDNRRLRLEYSVGQVDYSRRLAAIKELGKIGNLETIPALLYALGDPDFTACDAASKSLVAITGQSFRIPTQADPQMAYHSLTAEEKEALRDMFQNERRAWGKWLEQAHPNIKPNFDPYEKVAGNIDERFFWWQPPDRTIE